MPRYFVTFSVSTEPVHWRMQIRNTPCQGPLHIVRARELLICYWRPELHPRNGRMHNASMLHKTLFYFRPGIGLMVQQALIDSLATRVRGGTLRWGSRNLCFNAPLLRCLNSYPRVTGTTDGPASSDHQIQRGIFCPLCKKSPKT